MKGVAVQRWPEAYSGCLDKQRSFCRSCVLRDVTISVAYGFECYERFTGPPGPALFDSAFGLVAHLCLAASVTQASLRAANSKQKVAICTWMSHSQYFRVVQVMTIRRDHMAHHSKLPSKLLTPLIDRIHRMYSLHFICDGC